MHHKTLYLKQVQYFTSLTSYKRHTVKYPGSVWLDVVLKGTADIKKVVLFKNKQRVPHPEIMCKQLCETKIHS